jgi:hypothetical protein
VDDGSGTTAYVDLNFKIIRQDGTREGSAELFEAPFVVQRQGTETEWDNEYSTYPRLYGQVAGLDAVLELAMKAGRVIGNAVGREFLLSAREDYGEMSTPAAPIYVERTIRERDGRLVLAVALDVPVMKDLSIPLAVSGPEFTARAVDIGCIGKAKNAGTPFREMVTRGALSFHVNGETYVLRPGDKQAFAIDGRAYVVGMSRVTLPADGLLGHANFNIYEEGFFAP